jgi:hypothetical protein
MQKFKHPTIPKEILCFCHFLVSLKEMMKACCLIMHVWLQIYEVGFQKRLQCFCFFLIMESSYI